MGFEIAQNLLRNFYWNSLFLNQFQAHGLRCFLQYMELSGLELFLVIINSLANVGLAMFDEAVNDAGQFMGGSGDSFSGSQPAFHATVERAQSAFAMLQ